MKSDPSTRCPHCQAGDTASRVERVAGREAVNPADGDPCLCTVCGQWSVWRDGGLAKPDEATARRIDESPEAFKLKLGWLLWRLERKKKTRGLSNEQLLDIRNNVIDRCNQTVNDALQLVELHREALEIYLGVMLALVQNAAVVYGSKNDELDGEECIAAVLEVLATTLANMSIDETVTANLAKIRAERAKRGEGA